MLFRSPAKPAVAEPAPEAPRARTAARSSEPAVDASAPRRVTFNPSPANVAIGVDGDAPRDFGPSFREVVLTPGVHRFKFVGAHDCCIDEEITLRIPPGAEPFPIVQKLKFRPAGLYVVTAAPANVLVDGGAYSGRTRSVIEVRDMAQLTETHQIRISAEGHEDEVRDVRLQAGQVVTVDVEMRKREQGS